MDWFGNPQETMGCCDTFGKIPGNSPISWETCRQGQWPTVAQTTDMTNNTRLGPGASLLPGIDPKTYPYIHSLVYSFIHYITLHYITLHYITLHYVTSHYII